MVRWHDVERAALALPRARRGESHRGEASVEVGPHPFARRRSVEGRDALQFWCRDRGDVDAYAADPDRFFRVDVFKVKASVWVWLDRLSAAEMRELLVESWRTRTGRAQAPDPSSLTGTRS